MVVFKFIDLDNPNCAHFGLKSFARATKATKATKAKSKANSNRRGSTGARSFLEQFGLLEHFAATFQRLNRFFRLKFND